MILSYSQSPLLNATNKVSDIININVVIAKKPYSYSDRGIVEDKNN